ncbi:23S rRNA (guanosine(2251)-2'-O)-methyltransferase RlmB [Anoxynatronum sibiricum]|uniref:23S rRNA (Guanosine(2251)-2'-O)-methyltransferase RlmB n=1 Tax=Anoxynatronum sibiricum TaxID=210623 RepID=A0ABU9VYD3_9CLOT
MSDQLEGRNAVREALRAGREILEIFLLTSGKDRVLQEIRDQAKKKRVPVKLMERQELDRISRSDNHQGVIAVVPAFQYTSMEVMIRKSQAEQTPLILILDGVEDPHNLGSILRSAEVFGAHGVVIPKRRAAGVTPVVSKVASGALEHIPVAQVSNLTDTLKQLKKEGFWIAGGEGSSSVNAMDQDLTGPLGLVIGSEGKGISRLVREHCDYLVRIPMAGSTGSLNASVAAGVLLYEISRQRLRQMMSSEAAR